MPSFGQLNYVLLTSFTICLVGMVMLNALFDPLHVLHPPKDTDIYDRQARFGHVGILRHITTQDVFVGSSVFQDLDEAHYRDVTGREMTRLPVPGASPIELYELLDTLLSLQHKRLERVVIGMDFFVWGKESSEAKWEHFPQHLYSNHPFLVPLYIGSFQTFSRLIRLFPDMYVLGGKERTLHTRYRATYKHGTGRTEVFKHSCTILEKKKEQIESLSFAHVHNNMDLYIQKLLNDYPTIEFVFMLPPYSLLEYAQYGAFGKMDDFIRFRNVLGILAFSEDRLSIIDGQTDQGMMQNLDIFYDATHGGQGVLNPLLKIPVLSDIKTLSLGSEMIETKALQEGKSLFQEMSASCDGQ